MLTSTEFLTTSFLALALSADAMAVSMTSGLMIRNIKINKALKIALYFGFFQAVMPLIGLTFREVMTSIDHWIAFVLLGLIGGKMIYESLQDNDEEAKYNPLDNSTLFVLAIATSLDALAAGLGLSMLKSSILLACTLIGLITFGLSFCAVFLGHRFGGLFNQKIEILGGLILIVIGSKILCEHLLLG
jgi:putative Mn2+ efflux pump MntP